MSPLKQKLAEKQALAAQDVVEDNMEDVTDGECTPEPTPAPTPEPTDAAPPDDPDTPLEILLIPGVPISTPAEEINRHGLFSNTDPAEAFVDPLYNHLESSITGAFVPTGESLANVYLAVDRSRKGYQWSKGIIRPNVFGQYIPRTKEESDFLTALETSGILEKNPAPQKY